MKIVDSVGIAERIMSELEEEEICLRDENFLPIAPKKSRASFIDGSSYELLSSQSKDFYLIRLATERFDGVRKLPETIENFLAVASGDEVLLIDGIREEKIQSTSIDMSRTILEWKRAEGESTVFIDGSLDYSDIATDNDKDKDKDNVNNICGVMKTTRKSARRIATRAKELGLTMWAYRLEDNDYICKLNEFSWFVFELQTRDESMLSCAAYYARDPLLPGYPFGLMEAHRRAKIEGKEIKELRALLYAKGIDYFDLHDFMEV
jgi:hypothetical protein